MKQKKKLAGILFVISSLATGMTSCSIDSDNTLCSYNNRIENEYTFINDASQIQTVRDYLFDAKGVLLQVTNRSNEKLHYYESNLNHGSYTLISWANTNTKSTTNQEVIGKTKLDEMFLSMQTSIPNSIYQECSERLYYGKLQFDIPQTGTYRSKLQMQRAYASLQIQIKWADSQQIPKGNDQFNIRLRQIRGRYAFVQPFTSTNQADEINCQTKATMNEAGEIEGELITYRYSDTTQPLLRLYQGDTPITSEIDMTQLFAKLEVDMNRELRQEYQSVLEINGSRVTIVLNQTKEPARK